MLKLSRNKIFWTLLGSLALFTLLNACAPSPPNFVFMVQTSPTTGHAFWSLSGAEFDITDAQPYQGKTWTQWVGQSIVLPPDSYAAVKNYILLSCENDGTCPSASPAPALQRLNYLEQRINFYRGKQK